MSLPLPWVERIFDKLSLAYGTDFMGRWRDIDANAVQSDWGHELAAFENAPHAIAYALANLPEKPPTVLVFKAICRRAPALETPQLPVPNANPERIKAELAKLEPMRRAIESNRVVDRLAWAKSILVRRDAGEKISPTVVQMAQLAVGGV